MAITAFTGAPGHGKTTALASEALQLLQRNNRYYDEQNPENTRILYSNIKFNSEIEEKYSHLIIYFSDIIEMPTWKKCDIIIDELSLYFDSHDWATIPRQMKRYLRMHRHYEVDIYGAAQDFMTVDPSLRRLTTRLINTEKTILATREPQSFRPPAKYPFAVCRLGIVKPSHRELERHHYEYEQKWTEIYTRKHFKIFDTKEELPPIDLPPKYKRPQNVHYVEDEKIVKTTKVWV
jgi:hypothetical protein